MFRLLTILLTVACIAGGGSAVGQALPQIPHLQQNQIPAPHRHLWSCPPSTTPDALIGSFRGIKNHADSSWSRRSIP